MKFSLINVVETNGNKIGGYWLQNHIGTIDSAKELAKEINKVNSNRLNIEIVYELPHTNPALHYIRTEKIEVRK